MVKLLHVVATVGVVLLNTTTSTSESLGLSEVMCLTLRPPLRPRKRRSQLSNGPVANYSCSLSTDNFAPYIKIWAWRLDDNGIDSHTIPYMMVKDDTFLTATALGKHWAALAHINPIAKENIENYNECSARLMAAWKLQVAIAKQKKEEEDLLKKPYGFGSIPPATSISPGSDRGASTSSGKSSSESIRSGGTVDNNLKGAHVGGPDGDSSFNFLSRFTSIFGNLSFSLPCVSSRKY